MTIQRHCEETCSLAEKVAWLENSGNNSYNEHSRSPCPDLCTHNYTHWREYAASPLQLSLAALGNPRGLPRFLGTHHAWAAARPPFNHQEGISQAAVVHPCRRSRAEKASYQGTLTCSQNRLHLGYLLHRKPLNLAGQESPPGWIDLISA